MTAWKGPEEQGPMRRCLKKYGYDGVGCVTSDTGVVVFNPSSLVADGVFQFTLPARGGAVEQSAGCLKAIDPLRLATEAAESIGTALKTASELDATLKRGEPEETASWLRFQQDEATAYHQEIPRWQNCLRTFCTIHHLPMTGNSIAFALKE